MKMRIVAFSLCVFLAACTSEIPPAAPEASHTLPPKISLDVQAITLADRSGIEPLNSPYNSNHFTPTINEAIKQWASDRLQATGTSGQAIVLIKEASLTALPLAKKDDWFTREQALKYVARAEVSVEANGPKGFATADASATRSVTLAENPTATEKQQAYYELLNGLMKDLGENLDGAIQTHMASFITASPVIGTTAIPTVPAQPRSVAPVLDPLKVDGSDSLPPAPPTPAPVTPSNPVQSFSAPQQPATTSNAAVIPLSGRSQ